MLRFQVIAFSILRLAVGMLWLVALQALFVVLGVDEKGDVGGEQ
jgi:hypothetical protein